MPVAISRVARESGISQTQYQGTVLDVQRIQNALRAAERGNTWLLFTICRDMAASFPHLMSEWSKRKNVIVGQPMSLLPADAANPDDVMAVNVIREAIDNCENWQDGIKHLLDATLYPLSLAEKIFDPIGESDRPNFKYLRSYRLKELAPVNPLLFSFEVPYRGNLTPVSDNPAAVFNPDAWETWLRIYKTMPSGAINYNVGDVYAPVKNIHIIHRGGGQISPTIPPNFGGVIRAILFLWLFSMQDRDWWTLMMSKFGMPILVGKVDSSNVTAVTNMRQSLALAVQLGGIAIDRKAALEAIQVAGVDGSNAHKIFQDWLNCEVSKIVVGQVTSARPEKGGLAGGMAEQAEKVRDDIRISDLTSFAWTLEHQLFPQILAINQYRKGRVHVSWGGLSADELKLFMQAVGQGYPAGIRLADRGIQTLTQRSGVEWERVPDKLMQSSMGGMSGGKDKEKETAEKN
jgi:phage gp29-like protein